MTIETCSLSPRTLTHRMHAHVYLLSKPFLVDGERHYFLHKVRYSAIIGLNLVDKSGNSVLTDDLAPIIIKLSVFCYSLILRGTNMIAEAFASIAVLLLTSLVTRAVFRKWPKAGKWAIQTTPTACPNCKTQTPNIRVPSDIKELLWGGHTCHRCGTEYDKHGKERVHSR